MSGLPMWSRIKLHIRTLPHQLDRVLHVVMVDADVETQPIIRQRLHALDKPRAQAKIDVRLKLDDPSDALDARVLCQPFQGRAGVVAVFERCPGNNPGDARIVWAMPLPSRLRP